MWFLFRGVSFFLMVLEIGYIILLWHSLGLPYNYFSQGFKKGMAGHSRACAGALQKQKSVSQLVANL